ncbi:nitronate monooxygenase [Paracoccus sediminis]|uniref:Propionate 3-nitronate monooxygenase n=1 Tax=Paracoccus sediminis TaxID=1214787 RepID=A0A238VJ85_9RHOB|nr:nitronate monooxygenase [Paracoccus sediminis]TBN52194.1 nitronate monooxygenase [Paracoccus sediminis]SNR34435.1 nitronate monooxygenase [Paracoccus sediminis]
MFDGLKHRVVQAPMAGTSTPELAVAVCQAGGLGFLALGALDAAGAAKAIRAVRQGTDRAFGVNLFCHAPARRDAAREAAWIDTLRPAFRRLGAEPPAALSEIYPGFRGNDAMLSVLLAERPAIVGCHFGLPSPDQIAALKGAGCSLWATATSAAEGRSIRDAGFDAIVAQGYEAGGHRGIFDPDGPDGRLDHPALVRALVPLGLPVVAAGAIMDRAAACMAMDAGAVAVQCGTAFLRAPEAATLPAHRAALSGGQTAMTRAISGRPARCLVNEFTGMDDSGAADYPVAYDIGKALNAAAIAQGNAGYGAFWAGTGAAASVARPAADTVLAISP